MFYVLIFLSVCLLIPFSGTLDSLFQCPAISICSLLLPKALSLSPGSHRDAWLSLRPPYSTKSSLGEVTQILRSESKVPICHLSALASSKTFFLKTLPMSPFQTYNISLCHPVPSHSPAPWAWHMAFCPSKHPSVHLHSPGQWHLLLPWLLPPLFSGSPCTWPRCGCWHHQGLLLL